MGVYEDTVALAVLDLPLQDNAASTDVVNNAGNDATLTNVGNTDTAGEAVTVPNRSDIARGIRFSTSHSEHIALDSTLTLTGEFAVEFWAIRDDDTEQHIWSSSADTNNRLFFDNASGGTVGRIVVAGSAPTFANSAKVSADGWGHYVIVRNSDNTLTWYLDGVETVTDPTPRAGDWPIDVIATRGDLSRGFEGVLAHVRAYDQSLTALQASALYTGPTSYEDLLTDANLVARWNGDANGDDTGDPNDTIGSNDLTWTGTPAYGTAPSGKGDGLTFDLDGTGQSLYFDDATIRDAIDSAGSFSAWLKLTGSQPGSNRNVFGPDVNTVYRYVYSNASQFEASYRDGGGTDRTLTSGVTATADRWYHVTFTWEAGLQQLIIDGVLVDSRTDATVSAATLFETRFGIGGYNAGSSGSRFQGEIFDARIWTKALTVAEANALYTGPTATPSSIFATVFESPILSIR